MTSYTSKTRYMNGSIYLLLPKPFCKKYKINGKCEEFIVYIPHRIIREGNVLELQHVVVTDSFDI